MVKILKENNNRWRVKDDFIGINEVYDTYEDALKRSKWCDNEKANLMGEDDEVCDMCGGTGEIAIIERVYTNEPHMAPVGSRPCDCQLNK